MAIENIKLSKWERDNLLKLRRRTGIANWNILCRWAFCVSLSEPSRPRIERVRSDSPVEMTWRTFGGEFDEVYLALLKERCRQDGIELTNASLAKQFRLHLHRGIGYLADDPRVKSIAGLAHKALVPRWESQDSTV